ncbi:hypothetical protein T4E_5256 [Trichinella pseudospiralis]|uniref:Uncharacterized protein n=1 Tax=Trichinella pseudospiralis TaxID=6337 RepID=A0A0V0XU47_TRIPS|nr:hypothetical protein T4E_5256 [Trichinella pseudospiralis]
MMLSTCTCVIERFVAKWILVRQTEIDVRLSKSLLLVPTRDQSIGNRWTSVNRRCLHWQWIAGIGFSLQRRRQKA